MLGQVTLSCGLDTRGNERYAARPKLRHHLRSPVAIEPDRHAGLERIESPADRSADAMCCGRAPGGALCLSRCEWSERQ